LTAAVILCMIFTHTVRLSRMICLVCMYILLNVFKSMCHCIRCPPDVKVSYH